MLLFKRHADLRKYLNQIKLAGQKIGFVPTMGALHDGHLSLIKMAKKNRELVVCSIFVNPTQFNEQKDLETYPRTPHKDIRMLEMVGCDVLFMPNTSEVYPEETETSLNLDLGMLDKVMEGAFRPGHFDGVAQVVKRLLDLVQPHSLYMGQKDFQQWTIINFMIQELGIPVQLIRCPIIREPEGLAMSSRNARLSEEEKIKALAIFETLKLSKDWIQKMPYQDVEKEAMKNLNLPGLKPEYFKIVNKNTLLPPSESTPFENLIACTAVWVGRVRLIDNLFLGE